MQTTIDDMELATAAYLTALVGRLVATLHAAGIADP